MKTTLIAASALILIGAAILALGQFSYRSRETVLKIGAINATVETTKIVPLPPILGWALIGGGAVVLVYAARSQTQ